MSHKLTLCLDFDGVLHSYTSGWVDAMFIPDPPVPAAMEVLESYIKEFDVVIFSSRSNQFGGINAMRLWLGYWAKKELGLERGNAIANYFNEVEVSHSFVVGESKSSYKRFPLVKPVAFVTIDDRAITFDGNWPHPQEIKNFKPWNKQ